MYIKMTFIIRPSKLHQNIKTPKFVDIGVSTKFRHNKIKQYRTKLVLVSIQNHRCFNVKFLSYFDVDKMTLFRR